MRVRIAVLAGIAAIAVAVLAVLGPWSEEGSAHGPDFNNDGQVDLINDIFGVAGFFGQQVPTSPFPVLEQNLDQDGNIKVHEQGTVDVNVASQPTSQTPRTWQLFDNEPVPTVGGLYSALLDTDGCTHFTVFFEASASANPFSLLLIPSPDGSTLWETDAPGFGVSIQPGQRWSRGFSGRPAPYYAVRVQSATPVDVSVWLSCTP